MGDLYILRKGVADPTDLKDVVATAAELNQMAASLEAVDGNKKVCVARFTFDPTAIAAQRTVAAHPLGVTIPDNAIVLDGMVDVVTTFASANDSATIAIHVNGANDIVAAVAISDSGNPWDAGLHAVVPVNSAATAVKTTAAREITATVAVQALTAGKLVGFLRYVVSA